MLSHLSFVPRVVEIIHCHGCDDICDSERLSILVSEIGTQRARACRKNERPGKRRGTVNEAMRMV